MLLASSLTFLNQNPVLGYYANSADPVQMLPNAASDQDLHCFFFNSENSVENIAKMKTSTPKTRNRLIQMKGMDKSTGHDRVSLEVVRSILT